MTKAFKLNQTVKARHFITGYPVGLASDAWCSVAEISKNRGQSPRYRIVNTHGASFWVNHDDIQPLGSYA